MSRDNKLKERRNLLFMNRPECLHIPLLYEGKQAEISWEAIDRDKSFTVERAFNETFIQALSGYTWDNYDCADEPWNSYDQAALNWHQIEMITGKGQQWERLEYEQLSWSQLEQQAYRWKQLESREISFEIFKGPGVERLDIEQGCAWLEMDELNNSWSSFEKLEHSWEKLEKVTLPGISWDSIDSRWLTFNEWEEKDLTFDKLDTQNQVKEHREMTDFIPIGASNATYRIKAYDSNGYESEYLERAQLSVIPIFYRNSTMEYPVKAGKRYTVLMKAQEVIGLDKIRMNLRYNPYLLELVSFSAGGIKSIKEPGNYPEEHIKIYSSIPGNLRFQSTRQLNANECFSGPIALVEFIAKGTGSATVSLF